MPRNTKILITIVVIVAAVLIVAFWLLGIVPSKPVKTLPTPPQSSQQIPTLPPLKDIPTAVPIQIGTFRGTVTTVSKESITIKTTTDTKTFSMSGTGDIKLVTSGSFEAGNIETEQVQVYSLKADQEVLIISDKEGTKARSIIILK